MAPTSTAAATKKRKKQKSPLRQKKSIVKTKSKDKNNKPGVDNKSRSIKRKEKKKENGAIKTGVDKKELDISRKKKKEVEKEEDDVVQWGTATQQLIFFVNQYQSANGVELSSLELDSLKETCLVELSPSSDKSTSGNLGEHVKVAFGSSWKKVLCQKNLEEGQVDPGNPALLIISSSAIRALELLREMRPLTKECHAAKLFSKHMKIEEQVRMLKERVNIASGTPSRIKKLIEMEALGLSRFSLIVLDMHTDIKGYSLFTLPQVSDEFWDLYKSYFHQPLLESKLRLCLYGPLQTKSRNKKKKLDNDD